MLGAIAADPVKPKLLNSDLHVARPLVALGRAFAVLALLFCVTTPFVSDLPNRWIFLLVGFGYSAFLAFFVTGLLILPKRKRTRILTVFFVGASFSVLVPGIILAALRFDLPPSIILQMMPPFLWLTCSFFAVMFVFACYGWYHHLTDVATNAA